MIASIDFRSDDRRKSPRHNATGLLAIFPRGESRAYDAKMFNYSDEGMSFATDVALNVMSQVDVQVAHSTDLRQATRFKGRVVWGRTIQDLDSGIYRYGIKFVEPS
jgi:hypothetical protein